MRVAAPFDLSWLHFQESVIMMGLDFSADGPSFILVVEHHRENLLSWQALHLSLTFSY